MRLSVIVCLLEESERCLPAVMIFLQQRKDLLDHLSNENSQQKAAGWSLHVVALKSNLPALPLPLILLLALFFPLSPFFIHCVSFIFIPIILLLHVSASLLPTDVHSLSPSRLFSPHVFCSVLMSNEVSPAVVAPSSNNTSLPTADELEVLSETKKKTVYCLY